MKVDHSIDRAQSSVSNVKTIMTIEEFEKPENVYRSKQFKTKEVF